MKVSLVVPVFNEQDAIPVFYQKVKKELDEFDVEIIFVNDGSKDNTEQLINALAMSDRQ